MKNSFIAYSNWATIIDNLPREQAGDLSKAICHYFLTGEVIDLDPIVNAIFLSIRPVMDEDEEKYMEVSEKRRNAINSRWENNKQKQNDTNVSESIQKNTSVSSCIHKNYDNDTDNDNDNVSSNEDIYNVDQVDPVSEIVEYLNEKTESNFKAKTDNTKKAITARLKEGYTVEDFKKVIDDKVKDWADDAEMRGYLRPSTLFRPSNFEAYLNEANRPRPTPKKNEFQNFDQNKIDYEDLEKRLLAN